jgi:large subunit ribosomal protein L15
MNLSDVGRAGRKLRSRKRVGRGPGSGHGKTSGRGHKGAGARSSWKRDVRREGGQMPLFRRLPKRGFNNAAFATKYEVVNVGSLGRFDAGTVVGPEELKRARLYGGKGRVKVLAKGTLERALTVRAHGFSKAAVEKIETAGGRTEVI